MKKRLFSSVCSVILSVLLIAALCACDNTEKDPNGDYGNAPNGGTSGNNPGEASYVTVPDGGDMFTDADKDYSYDVKSVTEIMLSGSGASCSSSSVKITDGTATITSAGVFVVKGSATDFTITVDADKAKVRVVLSNVNIINSDFAALYIKNADKAFVILQGDNALSVTGDFVSKDENSVDGVIFAKDDITLQGDGTLTVESSKHGIVGKDDVKITGGTISVTADSHGIQANDSVRIAAAELNLTSAKDGIKAENTDDSTKGYFYFESGKIKINSGYDGISASSTIQINGGTVDVTAGGGSNKSVSSTVSAKGIKSQSDMAITDGAVTVNSADDCIHSNGSVEISGGALALSSGDDGVHADTSLIISGGSVSVTKSYEGLEAQNVTVSNGIINVKASDDGINAAGGNDGSSLGGRPGQNPFNTNSDCFIHISGGEIYVDASGDGVDANGSLTVSGGTTFVEGSTNSGNGALDYDGTASVTGGTFVAVGASGMAMNFSDAEQGSILLNVSTQQAGTTVSLSDGEGNCIFSKVVSKSYSSVLISVPSLAKGESYVLKAGTVSNTVTLTSLIYGSGSGMGGGGRGGFFRP